VQAVFPAIAAGPSAVCSDFARRDAAAAKSTDTGVAPDGSRQQKCFDSRDRGTRHQRICSLVSFALDTFVDRTGAIAKSIRNRSLGMMVASAVHSARV